MTITWQNDRCAWPAWETQAASGDPVFALMSFTKSGNHNKPKFEGRNARNFPSNYNVQRGRFSTDFSQAAGKQ